MNTFKKFLAQGDESLNPSPRYFKALRERFILFYSRQQNA